MSIDTNPLKIQRDAVVEEMRHLQEKMARLQRALMSINAALAALEGQGPITQPDLFGASSLLDAVLQSCSKMVDGITRQRVLGWLRSDERYADAKETSVAAVLTTLAQSGELEIVEQGKGRQPSYYTSQKEPIVAVLDDAELAALNDADLVKGTGGWQSLAKGLRAATKGNKCTLSPELRKRIFHYLTSYGGGGWQVRLKAILGRHVPHLFES